MVPGGLLYRHSSLHSCSTKAVENTPAGKMSAKRPICVSRLHSYSTQKLWRRRQTPAGLSSAKKLHLRNERRFLHQTGQTSSSAAVCGAATPAQLLRS